MLGIPNRIRTTSNQKGFTLIEVVLVLAIGGLIFLLAFLAFQQASKNRRDSQRRQNARAILAEVENYAANNMGRYPCGERNSNFCWGDQGNTPSGIEFYSQLSGTNLKDPSLGSYSQTGGLAYSALRMYTPAAVGDSGWFKVTDTIPAGSAIIWAGAKCSGGVLNSALSDASSDVAVWIKLERGQHCVDNTSM